MLKCILWGGGGYTIQNPPPPPSTVCYPFQLVIFVVPCFRRVKAECTHGGYKCTNMLKGEGDVGGGGFEDKHLNKIRFKYKH